MITCGMGVPHKTSMLTYETSNVNHTPTTLTASECIKSMCLQSAKLLVAFLNHRVKDLMNGA